MSNNTGGNSGVAGGGEQSLGPVSSSPVRQNLVPASAPSPAPPMSPSSSNASVRKKIVSPFADFLFVFFFWE